MDRRAGFVVAFAWLAMGLLSGCADRYSDRVRFRVRTDPVFLTEPSKMMEGKEFLEPDPPGQLPLFTVAKMFDPLSPYGKLPEELQKTVKANTLDPSDPESLSPRDRRILRASMETLFGTPQLPKLPITDEAGIRKLKVDGTMLLRGSVLYRAQCLTCHGLTGDGRGPTAPWVNPHPRDYRQGLFKFQSVDQSSGELHKPLREDLLRVLYNGVEGTSMPAFNLLPSEDLEALASYVIYLSIRGETEYLTLREGADRISDPKTNETRVVFNAKKLGNVFAALKANAQVVFQQWVTATEKPIEDGYYPFERGNYASEAEYEKALFASVQRGYAMFVVDPERFSKYFPADKYRAEYPQLFPMKKDKDGKESLDVAASREAIKKFVTDVNCAQCHTDFGRRALFKFDEWGTLTRARNLTRGVYRGGRRPIDLYWRIHSGINGSGMKSFGGALKPEQIWDLVNFVRVLPYPAMLRKYGIDID